MDTSPYKVLPRIPDDSRLTADRHTNTVFPITRFSSREDVEKRREELRFNLRMAAGLYPWPEKTPLCVKREPAAKFDGFTVEKIMFETRPGFWSTGNLYLPDPAPEKAPAILNVIGHWERQRLTRMDTADYPEQLGNFARMGFVCLVTDMIGMVDSRQISHQYGGGEKEEWLSNGLGVQLWNNIRALDLLSSMPEVDPERIGVTGASGGGSQSLFLALVDDRIKAAAPINMISLLMQGGCECENAPGLRRFTDNGEMCAMLAPRPLFLAGSTGDWTREQETREVPAVLEAYRQYGAEDMVEHYYQVADHQYNRKTRTKVYSFFARHLMGKDPGWVEQEIDFGDVDDLTWFRGKGHAPGIEGDEAFFEAFKKERAERIAGLGADEKRKMLAWITGIGPMSAVTADPNIGRSDGYEIRKTVVTSERGQQIPCAALIPDGWDGKRAAVVLDGGGKDILDSPEVRELLRKGVAAVSGDLFLTGEYADARVRVLGGGQGEKYYTAFHYTPDAFRAQDVSLIVRAASALGCEIDLIAKGSAAVSAACALPLLDGIRSAEIERDGLNAPCRIPGIGLLGGPAGCLELAACPVNLPQSTCPSQLDLTGNN